MDYDSQDRKLSEFKFVVLNKIIVKLNIFFLEYS